MGTNGAFPVFDWGKELVDLVADLVCVCRDGQVAYVNDAGARMLKGEESAIVGRPFTDFLHADYVGIVDLSTLVAEAAPASLILSCLDGSSVWTEVVARRSRSSENVVLVRAHDISLSMKAAELLRQHGEDPGGGPADSPQDHLLLAATIFDVASEAIVLCDTRRTISAVNPAFVAVTGHDPGSAVGARVDILASQGGGGAFSAEMWMALDSVGRWRGDVEIRTGQGGMRVVHVSAAAARDTDGVTHAYVLMIGAAGSDGNAGRGGTETAIDQATGLPRLAPFLGRLSQAVAGASRSGQRIGVMVIDVGGLSPAGADQKQIEAALGRAVGILTSCVRDYDTLARMGDSVFAIAMSNLEGPNSASIVARRIVQKFSQPSDGLRLTPAIGITVYPIDGPDTDSLLRDAETAMLKAKTFSAPNFRFFDQELNRDAQDRLSLWRELARAQERKEFHIHYQPRIELKNERATGMEALLRWRNPRLGDVEPLRFIPALEEIGGMEPLGAWMLEEVCRQQVEWTKAGHRSLRLSINLSERQLRQRGFLALVRDTVRRTGADPTRIEVEIVEEMLVRDAESCVATLWGLREIGVGVVLDNFGSGDGSVNHLRRFPISVVKVDPQFTGGFSGGRAPAVSAIAGMAHGFEQTVVAEAVETEEQLNVMRASGCDEAQGLLFCPPLPAVEMTARLGLGRWRTRARP